MNHNIEEVFLSVQSLLVEIGWKHLRHVNPDFILSTFEPIPGQSAGLIIRPDLENKNLLLISQLARSFTGPALHPIRQLLTSTFHKLNGNTLQFVPDKKLRLCGRFTIPQHNQSADELALHFFPLFVNLIDTSTDLFRGVLHCLYYNSGDQPDPDFFLPA